MTLLRILLTAASALTLAACAVGPTYHPPAPAPVTLATPAANVVATQPVDSAWWRAFGDLELDSLIQRALAANLDVRIALDRVREARALFQDTELDRLPRVTTGASYLRGKEQVPGSGPGRQTLEQADLGFDAAWRSTSSAGCVTKWTPPAPTPTPPARTCATPR